MFDQIPTLPSIEPLNQPKPKKDKLAWFKKHKKTTIAFIAVAVLLIAGGTVAALTLLNQKPAETKPTAKKPAAVVTKPTVYYSTLTGNVVKDQAAVTQAATAIMIENSPDARPQSGLKDSGVVFEAIAEGGITRFLVLYQQEKPQLVGPVRSVRMYYVDWAAAFNASIAHVGGSAAALSEVRNGGYRDIDQFFNSGSYYRATDRYAPHNVYTSFERLDALNAAKGYTTSQFTGFTRKDSAASTAPTASKIDIAISGPLYNSHYDYNATTNTYDRSQAGAPHLDREQGQISPRVVIALKVAQQLVLEDGYREQINTIGTGTAVIFQDGTDQEVTWKKGSKAEQITFSDATGKDVPLARGQTWVTAIPEGEGSVAWQ